jgi:hypothetical protein
VVDESVSVFELGALETLLVSHVFESFYDDIGHWYLANDIPCDQLTTIEIHKFMTSLLLLCRAQINCVQCSHNI